MILENRTISRRVKYRHLPDHTASTEIHVKRLKSIAEVVLRCMYKSKLNYFLYDEFKSFHLRLKTQISTLKENRVYSNVRTNQTGKTAVRLDLFYESQNHKSATQP